MPEDAVIAAVHLLQQRMNVLPKQTAESIARRVLAEYERVRAVALRTMPPGRWPWRVGNAELRERPNDLYEADQTGRWRYIGSLATPAHAEWCATARHVLAEQHLEEAYQGATRAADAFRASLTRALGLRANPGDAVLIASAERAIRIARGLPRDVDPLDHEPLPEPGEAGGIQKPAGPRPPDLGQGGGMWMVAPDDKR